MSVLPGFVFFFNVNYILSSTLVERGRNKLCDLSFQVTFHRPRVFFFFFQKMVLRVNT